MMRKITLGGGCYWCVEAVYQQLKGVKSVVSGFSGGTKDNPTYEEVCRETTGHAEVIEISYEDNEISTAEILEVFFNVHDPTTLNRQGADVGTQYRSVIFYHDDEQHQTASELKRLLDESGSFENPIVTDISPFEKFWPAGDYHQDYYNKHGNQPYCAFVIRPKLEKFKKVFSDYLKPEFRQ